MLNMKAHKKHLFALDLDVLSDGDQPLTFACFCTGRLVKTQASLEPSPFWTMILHMWPLPHLPDQPQIKMKQITPPLTHSGAHSHSWALIRGSAGERGGRNGNNKDKQSREGKCSLNLEAVFFIQVFL